MHSLFEVHMLNDHGKVKAKAIAQTFDHLLNSLTYELDLGTGREAAIVKTKLEEACFYAKKAMAMNPENQQ